MRFPSRLVTFLAGSALCLNAVFAADDTTATDEKMLRVIFDTALTTSSAYEQLRELTTKFPGRLAGSKNLEGAVLWGRDILASTGADTIELQPVMVPHWERGAPEVVRYFGRQFVSPVALAALALGGTIATPPEGVRAQVVEVQSLDEVKTKDVKGKIVFYNRPMNPVHISTGQAYGEAGDQRRSGPIEAAKYGAVGALVRSLTLAIDDFPHTGNTSTPPGTVTVPAVALSTVAANNLSAALKLDPATTVEMIVNARKLPDAQSHNVIGEIKGSEFPEKIILVGGHLDSWDIAAGAHDDGAGIVQSIEVMRVLKAIGYKPRHTLRVVLFTNEENGIRGAAEYSTQAKAKNEIHVLALESDSGGFAPRGFNLGNPAGNAHTSAARWAALFQPYGLGTFQKGTGGADVGPLLAHGATVAGLIPDSQRYFDYHHTTIDTIDKVNKRELELGAAAMAALVYLVDQRGL
ncbi:M20/M25/M40 family metallo-hydrolase [Oleiharenicola lentus]|uniref:M20/M25/M40 family metallo-hydrolase n=1 Tax=Oleiharenicola lentus TaxID=2508720 RepID=UPI003F662A61